MKKHLIRVIMVASVITSFPTTMLAADDSDPVTKNGERLQYNTPYYVRDKNLPHKGGVTFEPWVLDDYVLFAHSSTDNGIPIIFENKNKTDGFIKSDDWIRIKSTQASKMGEQYWAPDLMMKSVYLSSDDKIDHKIYGSSKDNSIGIGIFFRNKAGPMTKEFWEYKGANTEKSWLQQSTSLEEPGIPPLSNRQTPFELILVNE
ncbi:Kunitz family serine protease inhibitor [Bacillus sp. AF62]|uniref:Uncharacterized protein n=2 Tax=Bacillus TaxID=1386 RepID=A0A9W3PJL8_BACTU|nr:Kunitz family serine protease inhibitor [Bacillus thuringiensis]AHA75745.1 hypothetical protein YBT1518_31315 [Bacillus thuringiensis YBT-1518]